MVNYWELFDWRGSIKVLVESNYQFVLSSPTSDYATI